MLSLIDVLATTLVRFLTFLLRVSPPYLSQPLSYLIVRIVLLFFKGSKKTARKNLEIVFPNKTFTDRESIRKSSLLASARNLLDFARIENVDKKEVARIADLSEGLEAVCNETGELGCLFLIPHFGSFELLAHVWALGYKPSAILARAFKLPKLSAWWKAKREISGNRIFDRQGGFKEIIHSINSGWNVSVLFDQNIKRNHAIFVNLFGLKASCTKSVGIAAIRTGCSVYFAALAQLPNGKYKLHSKKLHNPINNNDLSSDEKITLLIQQANHCLEDLVRQYPEQWFWIHRRFKTRPKGEPENIYS